MINSPSRLTVSVISSEQPQYTQAENGSGFDKRASCVQVADSAQVEREISLG